MTDVTYPVLDDRARGIVKRRLHEKQWKIVFEKSDGSEREMIATTSLEHIPEEEHPKPKDDTLPSKPLPADVCRVFDVEKGAWRSFRFDKLRLMTPCV